ncbi:DUF4118 domain-containing protein [Nostoc sp. CHAB 5715]|uniref:DUF4118 domain-containing protein n=1 Tax=Nostoc sp. CHAB 5715 TaxID=2780400 RepID=UPI001E4C03AA|nr:DUF4118 domain-containing protein [Nostoc sp. CHAB 5715]MCC5621488.1 DUF4118 domain-containing protein [Nostoc sp. CHAB 5715]
MPYIRYSQLLRYGIVVLIVALALVLMLMLDPWLSMSGTPFLLFFSAVMVSAWYGGLKSGLLATGLSALLSGYFFLPPAYDLSFYLSNFLRIGLFALQGLLFSILCEALRTAKSRADENLQKLRVNEERFRLALSSSDIVVFQYDRNLQYQWIHNPQGIDTAEEMLGKSDDEKLHPQGDGVFGHGESGMGHGEEVTNAQCPMPKAAGRLSLSTHKGMEFPAAFDERTLA